ncbi:MAG: hypothetical protein QOE37_421, partial [Microbacteriaceae bacterium]|nr:hypothetical protein [Microbacteriaceae bacterium]
AAPATAAMAARLKTENGIVSHFVGVATQ